LIIVYSPDFIVATAIAVTIAITIPTTAAIATAAIVTVSNNATATTTATTTASATNYQRHRHQHCHCYPPQLPPKLLLPLLLSSLQPPPWQRQLLGDLAAAGSGRGGRLVAVDLVIFICLFFQLQIFVGLFCMFVGVGVKSLP
jgi:hypothetical protein